MNEWDNPTKHGGSGGCEVVTTLGTYIEQVAQSITEHEKRLADLKRIQEILIKHPDFGELLTLVLARSLGRLVALHPFHLPDGPG